jgi:cAMP-binding proteins - catabolite gene activator and regulatory subunit of cAMP-dependent protein kinases
MVAPTADALILRSMQSLANHGSVRELNPGEVVFAAAEPGDCFFGVLDGEVRLAWGDGSRYELLRPGQCFGEGALVQRSHTRHGTAMATEPTRLLVINRETFLFAMETLPMFSLELLASLEGRLQSIRLLSAR